MYKMSVQMCVQINRSQTFKGMVMQRHLSRVMKAVMKMVTRVNNVCGQAAVKYWTSSGSNGRSRSLKDGLKQIFDHMTGIKLPRSDMAKPGNVMKEICLEATNLIFFFFF
jgi:hypothetical protein